MRGRALDPKQAKMRRFYAQLSTPLLQHRLAEMKREFDTSADPLEAAVRLGPMEEAIRWALSRRRAAIEEKP